MNEANNIRHAMSLLMDAWNILAPTKDRDYPCVIVRDARKEQIADYTICRRIVGALYDGLSAGNWPSEQG